MTDRQKNALGNALAGVLCLLVATGAVQIGLATKALVAFALASC